MQILQHAPGRYIVEGSKGQAYHVKQFAIVGPTLIHEFGYSCDCPGSIYGHECRHIKAVKVWITQDIRV